MAKRTPALQNLNILKHDAELFKAHLIMSFKYENSTSKANIVTATPLAYITERPMGDVVNLIKVP